jgi:hypothetical protein
MRLFYRHLRRHDTDAYLNELYKETEYNHIKTDCLGTNSKRARLL